MVFWWTGRGFFSLLFLIGVFGNVPVMSVHDPPPLVDLKKWPVPNPPIAA